MKKHILIVEDDVEIAHQLSHYLRGLGGYRVHVSRYGHAALNYVREAGHPVDRIVRPNASHRLPGNRKGMDL